MEIALNRSVQWENYLLTHHGHLLQSWRWGELKSHFGWTPRRVQVGDGMAQILFRQLPLGQTIAYIPKGPLVDWRSTEQCQALLAAIHAEAKKHRAIFLKIEPDTCEAENNTPSYNKDIADLFISSGFVPADTIQPQTSILINIEGDEDSILAAMKQKTRYNIRLAKKKGVVIHHGTAEDIALFYSLSQLTSARDGFGIHSLEYYQKAYQLFSPDHCALLIAEFEQEPLAALMAFRYGENAYYLYGASSNTYRNLMPTYLIQWEAMRWAKGQGCRYYDLWGIPNADLDSLEANFKDKQDGMWGVYRFKRGFGGEVVKSIGAYDYIYNPLLYKLYKALRKRQTSHNS